jgi:hypothetical protein
VRCGFGFTVGATAAKGAIIPESGVSERAAWMAEARGDANARLLLTSREDVQGLLQQLDKVRGSLSAETLDWFGLSDGEPAYLGPALAVYVTTFGADGQLRSHGGGLATPNDLWTLAGQHAHAPGDLLVRKTLQALFWSRAEPVSKEQRPEVRQSYTRAAKQLFRAFRFGGVTEGEQDDG